jgi:hypothetical protein
VLSRFLSWQGYITNTSGYNFRKGHGHGFSPRTATGFGAGTALTELNANFLCSAFWLGPFYKISHNYKDMPGSVDSLRGQESLGPDGLRKLTMFIKPRRLGEHCLNGCSYKPAGCGFGAPGIFTLDHSVRGHRATCLTFPTLAKLLDQKP